MATARDERIEAVIITFSFNPKWPEVTRFLNKRNLKHVDRPDIVCRIFKIKLDALMRDLTEREHFGKTVSGCMYKVVFDKGGLPHAHIVLLLHPISKLCACTVMKSRNTSSDQEGNEGENDQKKTIRDFFDCRYKSACEAAWRILNFSILKLSSKVRESQEESAREEE